MIRTLTFIVLTAAMADPAPAQTRKQQDRARIESEIRSLPRNPPITSRDRTTPPSAAHNRGAVDYRSNDISTRARHREASTLSQRLGGRYTVVVEEVHRPARGAAGPSAQINTAYRGGNRGNTRVGPIRATGTHTHVQPESGGGGGSRGIR